MSSREREPVLGASGIRAAALALVVFFTFVAVTPVFLMQWYYAVIFYLSAFALAISFFKPKTGAYSLIFLVPFTTVSFYLSIRADWNFVIANRFIDLVPVFSPVVFAAFLGLISKKLIKTEHGVSGNLIYAPLIIIVAYSGLTMLWSDLSLHNLFQFLIFAMNIIIFILITYCIKDEDDLRRAVWCWILSGLFQALSYLVLFFFDHYIFEYKLFDNLSFGLNILGGFLQPSGKPQVDSGFMDHHELALMMNLVIAVSFGLFLTIRSKLNKAFLALLICVFILVILRTESRGGIGSLFLMVFSIILAYKKLRKYFLPLYFIFCVGISGFYVAENYVIGKMINKDVTPRLLFLGKKALKTKDVVDPGLKDKDTGRTRLWKKSFKKYGEYWIQGFGVGNLKKFLRAPHAHNVFFSFLFDFGLVGLATFAYIFFALLKRIFILFRYQSSYLQIMSIAFATGLVAIAVHGQVDFEYNTTLLWVYLALAIATFRIAYQDLPHKKPC